MKNLFKTFLIFPMILLGTLIHSPVQADPPGMPGDHGIDGDTPPGGGAPIGGGVLILSALGMAYALTKNRTTYFTINVDEK